jgi:hypothetical protein
MGVYPGKIQNIHDSKNVHFGSLDWKRSRVITKNEASNERWDGKLQEKAFPQTLSVGLFLVSNPSMRWMKRHVNVLD